MVMEMMVAMTMEGGWQWQAGMRAARSSRAGGGEKSAVNGSGSW